ncbi:MAG: hypothetical protein NPIRA05_18600 [Nitrospirales bacterium]|nr:MAG: hypothetical protein NPIRA05_18600 [Nitrospirales bacterium]
MSVKRFSDKEIMRYIEAVNKEAAQEWITAFAREPKLQQSYYWTLFSELFLKQRNQIPVSMSDAEKIIPQLSASQARRAIRNAKDANYLEIQATGTRTKNVQLTSKAEAIIRKTSAKALKSMEEIFRQS